MSPMSISLLQFLFLTFILLSVSTTPNNVVVSLSNPDPNHSTIPAFPSQNDAACSLTLPAHLPTSLNSLCSQNNAASHYTRCCPVLAAWLYSAYSTTALARAAARLSKSTPNTTLPTLPDDSESCVDEFDKGLVERGIRVVGPNQSCDLVYCYCGIRLRPLRCPEAFRVDKDGEFVGDEKVEKLETECLSSDIGFYGSGGCSKCLHALNQLGEKTSNSSSRSKKMYQSDCQIMGMTWLLAKNRSAYIRPVSGILRSIMTSGYHDDKDDADNDDGSCTMLSDGMPFAVDSNQISNVASARELHSYINYLICRQALFAFLVWLCYTGGPLTT